MNICESIRENNNRIKERYELTTERIHGIVQETTIPSEYANYFQTVGSFLLYADNVYTCIESNQWTKLSTADKKVCNHKLYEDILPQNYGSSYANPTVAKEKLGNDIGGILSVLYMELRNVIVYAFEQRLEYMTICNELFIQVYNCCEDKSIDLVEELSKTLYWYASDYCDVFLAERIREQVEVSYSFARNIIMDSNLMDLAYLYDFGEYITENEIKTAQYLQKQPEQMIDKMARVFVEGFERGFVNTGKDLSRKKVVNIRYVVGFELVVKRAVELFHELGLEASIYRATGSLITKRQQHKIGYYGAIPNKQCEYDHKDDQGILLDKKYLERKLDVTKHTYELYKNEAATFAGPAVMEVFGEEPFSPQSNIDATTLTEQQEKLILKFESKSGQLINQYIKGEERSFTIIAYPVPEIGSNYEAIFSEVIKINTLDANVYEKVQQCMIDVLDQGDYVRIIGQGDNRTDLKIKLAKLNDPTTETVFENCVADVNIPVGEVFTSPVLEGSFGLLHVTKVFLNELQYVDLEITLEDGMVTSYACGNFENPEEGAQYIKDNILYKRETLPIGEFAIGTNTTAYQVAKKYQIEDKMPILIAEKMGPHFALGDTCYSWSEDVKVYNPNGKEIIAKDNSVSILRKSDVSKAYVNCHTDITIPYEELKEIVVVTAEGTELSIIENGRFVLKGTEILNEPLKCL